MEFQTVDVAMAAIRRYDRGGPKDTGTGASPKSGGRRGDAET